jgi:hypothetical protein
VHHKQGCFVQSLMYQHAYPTEMNFLLTGPMYKLRLASCKAGNIDNMDKLSAWFTQYKHSTHAVFQHWVSAD